MQKRKYLYLLGTDHALAILSAGRALNSVFSRNETVRSIFAERFGARYRTGEYFSDHSDAVAIKDASFWLSELAESLIEEPVTDNVVG